MQSPLTCRAFLHRSELVSFVPMLVCIAPGLFLSAQACFYRPRLVSTAVLPSHRPSTFSPRRWVAWQLSRRHRGYKMTPISSLHLLPLLIPQQLSPKQGFPHYPAPLSLNHSFTAYLSSLGPPPSQLRRSPPQLYPFSQLVRELRRHGSHSQVECGP